MKKLARMAEIAVAPVSGSRSGYMLLLFTLLMSLGTNALAGEFCSVFPEDPPGSGVHVIDGDDPATVNFISTNNVTQITVDTDCTFRNWDPLTVTINFQTPAAGLKPIYLIVFDNVNYTGNMACANIDHKIWMVNGSSSDFSSKCQDLFIPVEAIGKEINDGKTSVGIGEPFTYTLNVPVLYDPVTGTVITSTGTDVDVHSAIIVDDLNEITADLTLLSTNVTTDGGATTLTPGVDYTFTNNAGELTFDFSPYIIPMTEQLQIEIELVADNTTNPPGTTFFNTARWTFGRVIPVDPDGDGIFEDKFFDPLPGENGISPVLTIGAPDLTVTKSSLDTTLSPAGIGNFTIDVQNNGTSPAWDATIVDVLPESGTASMCTTDPTTLAAITVGLFEADGTTEVFPGSSTLTAGAGNDYTVSWAGSPTCELSFVMAGTNAVIAPSQRLIIDYQAQLNAGASVNGEVLSNIAGAIEWFSADAGNPRAQFAETLSADPATAAAVDDFEDSFDVTVGLAGYYFQKTVSNNTSLANPTTSAAPGDSLRYRLRVFNVNQTVNGVEITDDIDALSPGAFDLTTLTLTPQTVIDLAALGGVASYDIVTGILIIDGGAGSLDIAQGQELVIEFDITLSNLLVNDDVVSNQALIDSTSGLNVPSDNPFVNGIDDPQDGGITTPDITDIVIQTPGALSKTDGPATTVVGETVTYTITVPATAVATPLYDVRVLDTLGYNDTPAPGVYADISLVSVSANLAVGSASWTLSSSVAGDETIIEDLVSGIDIPANDQAVITITARVDNTTTNQAGVAFKNTATYSYNRTNGVSGTQTIGAGATTTVETVIEEPGLVTFTKAADNTTPTVGETVHYTVTMEAASGANTSDVFDLTLVDNLDLGLAYVANSAEVCTGPIPGTGCTAVLSTDIVGDGITTPQTLNWGVADVDIDIPAGNTVFFEYDVVITSAALANQQLNNSVAAQWTSIDGGALERDGTDGFGGLLNDYATDVVTAALTTPNLVTSIDKQRTDDTYGTGDDDVRIGDLVEYTLTVSVPEGILGDLTLVDTLPAGLAFEDVVSINFDTTGGDDYTPPVVPNPGSNFTYAAITPASVPIAGQTGAVTWALGDISNPFDDTNPDDFVIVYRARVQNGDVLTQQDNTSLNNEIRLSFDDALGPNINVAEDLVTAINVVQPNVTVNKFASAQFGDVILVAGEVVTYTVDIINTGTAPVYDAVLQDTVPAELLAATPIVVDTTSITLHDNGTDAQIGGALADLDPVDTGGGVYAWDFDSGTVDQYTIAVNQTLRIVYTVTAESPLADGLTLTNSATATVYYSLDDDAVSPTNATASREDYGPSNTASTNLYTGAPPSKVLLSPAVPEATIGEDVIYTITVPQNAPTSTLFDVNITDALDPKLLHVVADTTINITGTGSVITNNNTAAGLDITVDQIDAGTQVVIELHARVTNANLADDPEFSEIISNAVSYAYAFTDGGAQQPALSSGNVDITVVEPQLTMTKAVTDTALNPVTDAVAGDVLRYTLTLTTSGGANFSDAFDVSIIDDLSLGLAYQAGTATIDAVLLADPFNVTAGDGITTAQQLEWSLANSGADIDIPEGTVVTITYDVLVLNDVAAGQTLMNSAVAQWTSLDGADINGIERDGSDGFGGDPNDYETEAQATLVTVPDTNSITKSKLSDTFNAADADVRNGDTVTYQLDIALQEGATRDVVITDDLDVLNPGLEFVGIVSIDGDAAADYDPVSGNFSYGTITPGDINYNSGTAVLTISISDVVNTPDGNAANDTLTIIYEATVNVPAQTPSTLLDNAATLGYDDFTGNPVVFDPLRHESTVSITGLQPVMTTPTKVDAVFTSPANVSIATDTMQFTLESCNTGQAPAYNVQISDDLPSQLDETSITGPLNGALQPDVYINGVLATEGAGNNYVYNWSIPRDGVMVFTLNDSTPVNPGECVTIQYNIGFHTDFGPNQNWNNSVTVGEYWSLPTSSGTQYGPEGPATFNMSNNVIAVDSPLKVLTSPAASQAIIGEEVVYTITVPENPVNAAIYEVRITDTLDPKLVHLVADTTINITGTGNVITNNNTAAGLDFVVDQIDAGTQVVIELHARVSNANLADDPEFGEIVSNTASFEYSFTNGGLLEPLLTSANVDITVVEPQLTMTKAVTDTALNPVTDAVAGDVLRYTLTLTTSGGANFSDAFDVSIIDDLSLGLAYQAGTATIDAVLLADPFNVTAGDGITTAQQLEWSLANSGADIDIPEGTVVTITYDLLVLNQVVAGQTLTNSAVGQWTSLDGLDINGIERDGSDGFGGDPNDYETEAQATLVTVPDNTVFSKARISDTFGAGDVDVRIGDTIDYRLDITLQEGTTSAISISDTLDSGLEFVGIISINNDTTPDYDPPGIGTGSNFSYNNVTAAALPPVGDTGTLTFTLGDVTNDPAGDATTDTLSIVYRARVMDSTLTQANGIVLNNNAQLDYNAGSQLLSSASVTVRQPFLTVTSKNEDDADDILEANDTVNYTVLVTNSGDGPAYDPVIVDTLPVGMRDTAPVIVSVLINGTPVVNPSAGFLNYDAGTGEFRIDFGEGATYATPPGGGTLQVVYTVTADADLGAGITMINSAIVQNYYSFDDDAQPEPPTVDTREVYGPSVPPAILPVLMSPTPGAVLKQSPNEINAANSTEVTIGETFTYRITVPEIPVNIALHDVRIIDNLVFADIGADLSLVSFTASGTFSGTPVNTGTATNIVIADAVNGIDIPANGQVVLDITVEVVDSANNVPGTTFSNIANWIYNTVQNDAASVQNGTGDTSAAMTIIGPDTLIMNKSGPANVRVGLAAPYTLDVFNDNTSGNSSDAWYITISDQLPDTAPGGMCDTDPDNFVANITGTNPVALTFNTDYTVNFDNVSCLLTITMQTANAVLPPDHRLVITYDGHLDADTPPVTNITNIAGVTNWFSNDTAAPGASGEIRTYTELLSIDPAIASAIDDHEDAVTAVSESPEISFQKQVVNLTTGQNPGRDASPGDQLLYTITITNQNEVDIPDFSFTDDLGALNTGTIFNSLSIVSISQPGAVDNSDPAGGNNNGNGLVDISNLSLGSLSSGNNTVTIIFDVFLEPIIDSGTVVSNQGLITAPGVSQVSNDFDANPTELASVLGDEVTTDTTITSAPVLLVQKSSQDLTGDPAVLQPGDRLRYTITVKNIGNENMVSARLSDQVPSNTTYDPDSTNLNGSPVGQPDVGVSPLIADISINAPENNTPGFLRADVDPAANNVATITFDVIVDSSVIAGTVISNQGFVNGEGAGSGVFPQQPSDDPTTAAVDDPTIDIVGNIPFFDVQKTVALAVDNNANGLVNTDDVLRYTITVTNFGAVPITNAVLVDPLPNDTTYEGNSTFLNGLLVPDPAFNVLPLIAGIDISSSDLTPPLPSAGAGTIMPGQSAVIMFDVRVNLGTASGTAIVNQGSVSSNELPDEPTDVDGIDTNGDQPTVINVGDPPLISIIKQVTVVGGGPALAGGQLEYVVRVTNTGVVPATDVVIEDDLDLTFAGQMTYVIGSGLLNGLSNGVSFDNVSTITANYGLIYGPLPVGGVAELRFRVDLNAALNIGDVVTNDANVDWDTPAINAATSVSIAIGGTPGAANLSGLVWHDADFDNAKAANEVSLADWRVELYQNNVLLGNVQTDANGVFSFSGLPPNLPAGIAYEVRYLAPGATAATASLGQTSSAFTDGPQIITDIFSVSGAVIQNLNLPRQPNGIVYDSVQRVPVTGTRLTMINQTRSNQQLSTNCFTDAKQQNQVTRADGFYKFDLKFGDSTCAQGDEYVVHVQPPANGFVGNTSVIIPPVVPITGTAKDVPGCLSDGTDKIPATALHCENSASAIQPPDSVEPRTSGTDYNLKFLFNDAPVPSTNQIFNNHIPVDPKLEQAVAISKVAGMQNVTRSQLVPYTITLNNTLSVRLSDLNVIDNFPAGFKYMAGSSRVDGVEMEPLINGRQLTWPNLDVEVNESRIIKLLLVVGSGVGEGEYVNTAHIINSRTGEPFSGVASATVQVIPDPTFDCTDIIGKVYGDANNNAYQDQGEKGIPGVQVATTRGLRVTTDTHGRFHITCAIVANEVNGSNFIMKVDDRSLPSGYRITTENPRVQRATRGKMMKFNFGASIHRVVRLDLADGVFEKGLTALRPQWQSRIDMLITELQKDASILRLSYLGENESESGVDDRLDAIENLISDRWQELDCCYKLTIEKEVFWRKGNPSERKGFE